MDMPGDVIKLIDSQEDWEAGILTNLDAETIPGSLVPTGDHVKDWKAAADWNSGTKTNVVAVDDKLVLDQPELGNDVGGTRSDREHHASKYVLLCQRLHIRGTLQSFSVQVQCGGYSPLYYPVVAALDGTILWTGTGQYMSLGSDTTISGEPNLVTDEDVYVGVKIDPAASGYANMVTGDAYPPDVGEGLKYRYEGDPAWSNQGSWGSAGYVRYKAGYEPVGSWLSPWVEHGVVSPHVGFPVINASVPQGTTLTAEIRHSSDGGTTPGEWIEFKSGEKMTDPFLTHYQVRLSLETEDLSKTPEVSRCAIITNPLHKWVSPLIDVSGGNGMLMLVASKVGLNVDMFAPYGPYFVSMWGIVEGLRCASGIFTYGGDSVKVAVELIRTNPDEEVSLDSLTLYGAVLLQMIEDPVPRVRPPEITDVVCYVEDSEPLIEVTASLGVPDDEKVEVRISVPAGSSEEYAQAYADAYLADHGAEKRSLTCKVGLVTRVTFGELVAVAVPSWGYTEQSPWLAMVQKIAHRPLVAIPHTELTLGDFEPDDTEALVRLLTKE